MSRIHVFGYGSLVGVASAVPATLAGWRAVWNVGTDTGSHPEREFRAGDGTVYGGVVAVLGIEPGDGCSGAVFEAGVDALPALDRRERNYERHDVTAHVDWPGRRDGGRVFTYVPRADARRRLAGAPEAVVRTGYYALVRAAFGERAGHVPVPPFPLRDLTAHVRLVKGG